MLRESPIKAFIFFVLSLPVVFVSTAQDNIRLNFRHIPPRSGLSSVYVRKIVQDPYGFMWIGTEDGVNRYDGKNFIIYNKGKRGRHSLTGMDTRDLLIDTAHHLVWEINSFGGIDAIDYVTGYTAYSYRQADDRSTADIVFNGLAINGNHLFIGSTNGLYMLDIGSKRLTRAVISGPFPAASPLSIDNVLADKAGHLWLFCRDQGLLLLNDSSFHLLDFMPQSAVQSGITGIQFYESVLLRNGTILSATNAGLRGFSCQDKGKINVCNDPLPGVPLSHGHDTYTCREDRQGYIWFSTAGSLVRASTSDHSYRLVKEHTSRAAFSWLDAVYSICFDREDNVWLGCQAGLAVAQNAPSAFTSITGSSVSETTIHHAYFLNPVDDTTLYCCAQEGLYRVNPVKGIVICLDNSQPWYQALIDPNGRLLAAGINGMYVFENGRKIPVGRVYPAFRQLGNQAINSHCYCGDSLLIFGTRDRGVIIWNYRSNVVRIIDRHSPDTWLKDNYVCTVYTDHKGLVWVLGYKSISLLDFAHHTVRSVSTYDSARNTFYSLLFDVCEARGHYYVASYGAGIIELDSDYHFIREISSQNGLSANSVYKIMPYRDSLLFVTSNNGLSAVDVTAGYLVRNYFESDGLHSDNFEEYSGAVRNGIIYAGGADGLTVINPALFTSGQHEPAVYVRTVTIETPSGVIDTSNLLLNTLEIPEDALQTTVYFSALDYRSGERSRLSYRMKELDGGWIDMGTRDFVPFIGLRPGKYTILVRPEGKDGNWSSHPIELQLRFRPHWYQTTWFMLVVIFIIGTLLYGFYRYRIRQLQKQQQIRKDIAGDLHDDIGSTLNTVKIFTHLARREDKRDEYLVRIEESLTQATSGLRDMIWVLDDAEDSVRELADRIKKFGLPVVRAHQISFECTFAEQVAARVMTKTVKRNLLLIAKECINNSLKYADCQHIWVHLDSDGDKLSIRVGDDGKGFDAELAYPGNGLRNIQYRAKQIRFFVRINSATGKGTVIELKEG